MSIVGEPFKATITFGGTVTVDHAKLYLTGPGVGQLFDAPGANPNATKVDGHTFQLLYVPTKPGRYWVVADAFDSNSILMGSDDQMVDVEPADRTVL